MSGAGRASDFAGAGRRGKIGRTLRGGSPVRQEDERIVGGPPVPSAAAGSAGGKPVRITVDLDAERHRRLKLYALDSGARAAAVVRALLDELEEDPDLAARVRDRMHSQ